MFSSGRVHKRIGDLNDAMRKQSNEAQALIKEFQVLIHAYARLVEGDGVDANKSYVLADARAAVAKFGAML